MNGIDVSVITPTFNRSALLPRVWQSISGQSCSFEWIVVDDGSTDNTEQVISSLADQRITYHRLPINRGVNTARNTGVSLASGRYIVFLDSDDELFPESLSHMVSIMDNARSEIGAAVFTCVMHETGKQVSTLPDGQILDEYDVVCRDALYDKGEKLLVYRREVFADNILPEDLRGCEHVFVFGVAKTWKILLSNRPLRVIHRQEDNLSNADSLIARSFDIARSYERLILNHGAILEKNRSSLIRFSLKALYRYAVARRRVDAFRVFCSLLKQPCSVKEFASATAYLLIACYGAPLIERWRINRINSKLLGLQS